MVVNRQETTFDAARLARIQALEGHHFWFVARRRLVLRLLNEALARSRPRLTALDVGCGTGSLALQLSTEDIAVLAIDIHRQGLERIRREGAGGRRLFAVQGDAVRLPVRDHSVDGAVALDVLEHAADDEQVLREIGRVVKPGGFVIVTVPALAFLWSSRDEEAGHMRRYSRRAVKALAARAHLEVREVRFYQCLLLPALMVTRWIGRRWPATQRVEEAPAGWINRLCLAVNHLEIALGDVLNWPFGSSIAILARKPA